MDQVVKEAGDSYHFSSLLTIIIIITKITFRSRTLLWKQLCRRRRRRRFGLAVREARNGKVVWLVGVGRGWNEASQSQ